jgi:hypothetical protein
MRVFAEGEREDIIVSSFYALSILVINSVISEVCAMAITRKVIHVTIEAAPPVNLPPAFPDGFPTELRGPTGTSLKVDVAVDPEGQPVTYKVEDPNALGAYDSASGLYTTSALSGEGDVTVEADDGGPA